MLNMKSYIRRVFSNKLISNSSWLIANRLASLIIGIIVSALIARYFGPETYGEFTYAQSIIALFSVLSSLGLETLTVKSLIEKKESENTIIFTSFILRLIGGVILTILAIVLIYIVNPNNSLSLILISILSVQMIFKSFEVIEYWIQAHHLAKKSSILRLLIYCIVASMKILVVIFKGNIIHFALLFIIDALLIGIGFYLIYEKNKTDKEKYRFNFPYASYILKQSWYLILAGLMITMYSRIDQLMLGNMFPTKQEVGVYSIAVNIANMWYFIPTAIIISYKPLIMSDKNFLKYTKDLYVVVTWIGIFIAILFTIFSDLIILSLYGYEYRMASQILSIIIWGSVFAMIGTARSLWLLKMNLQKFTLYYTFIGLITNIILNLVLIPSYSGIGAAYATLVSQFVVVIVALLPFKKTRVSSIMIFESFSPISLFRFIKAFYNKIR